jgi:hypothetical protein
VKRLSESSTQGVDELKNELALVDGARGGSARAGGVRRDRALRAEALGWRQGSEQKEHEETGVYGSSVFLFEAARFKYLRNMLFSSNVSKGAASFHQTPEPNVTWGYV